MYGPCGLQASRLREEAHTMGSIYMSENCTELKNLRSLVRVCEIQATLREQRYAWHPFLLLELMMFLLS